MLTFAPGFPSLREVVTAARAASRLNDSRFAQVFDVEDDWDHAYIVMEWAAGDSLDDMLAAGPLDAARGARIVAEAAEAMSVAHAAGLAHLCLNPDSLRWTAGGGVKITGLGINAALTGASAEDPGLADTRSLGMLLYAALTGCWPGPDCPSLPPAPLADGLLCSPRQVRAGVPAVLDEITSQTLMLKDADGSVALTTPGELAAALLAAIPPVPIPQLPPPAPSPRSRGDAYRHSSPSARQDEYQYPDEREPGYWTPDGQRAPARPRMREPAPGRRGDVSRSRSVIIAVVAIVIAAGLAAIAYRSLHHGGKPTPGSATHQPTPPRTSSAAGTLTPVSDQAFEDNPADANLAIDNSAATAWQTYEYIGNPAFGGLQQGSGLILNMGHSVRLKSVRVTFESIPGADVQIKIGNPSDPSPPQNDPTVAQSVAAGMTTVAQQNDVTGAVTFSINSKASGQYVLIWFTRLAPMANHPNKFQGDIYNVVVNGSG